MKRAVAPLFFAILCLFAACTSPHVVQTPLAEVSRELDPRLSWEPGTRERLNDFLERPEAVLKLKKPWIAAFDWDNTIVKNDISDALVYYMLRSDRVRFPRSWSDLSPFLTRQALMSLEGNCSRRGTEPRLETSRNPACATALLCITRYDKVWDGVTTDGSAAARCSGADAFRVDKASADIFQPGYAMTVALQSGYTPAEIREMALKVFRKNVSHEIGATASVGYVTGLNDYVRVYDQMKDLIQKLKAAGCEPWVITASGKYSIDGIAPYAVGIPAEHVVGVTSLLDQDGRMTPSIEGCGPFANGKPSIIPYRQGKRCFLNKEVFHLPSGLQLETPSPIAFAAGDSDSDVFFLQDSRGYRLVIDRHKEELLCRARLNRDGRWLVSPMFIKPLAPQSQYDCRRFGLK